MGLQRSQSLNEEEINMLTKIQSSYWKTQTTYYRYGSPLEALIALIAPGFDYGSCHDDDACVLILCADDDVVGLCLLYHLYLWSLKCSAVVVRLVTEIENDSPNDFLSVNLIDDAVYHGLHLHGLYGLSMNRAPFVVFLSPFLSPDLNSICL